MNDNNIHENSVGAGPDLQGTWTLPAATSTATRFLTVQVTDIGHDPDDAIAVVIAARKCQDLCVVTSDETMGRRARMARHLLDLLDRPDVPVIEGVGGLKDGHKRFRLDADALAQARVVKLIPLVQGLIERITDFGGPVVWVGQGPMAELAHLLMAAPHLAERIQVVQMGGWLDHYRNKSKASHNLDTDQLSAGVGLRLAHRPQLVLSDHTNVSELEITPDAELYRQIMTPSAPAWAQLVAANFTAWWDFQRGRGVAERSRMHDPLTLSAGLGERFVSFAPQRISIASDGRIRRDQAGREVHVSTHVDYIAFNDWMYWRLHP